MPITEQQTSSRQINGLIKRVRTSGDKYNNLVQEAIVAIIRHANDYGDCTGAARLVDAMPKSNRRTLVIDHFGDYSPIRVSKDAKTGAHNAGLRKPENKAFKAFDIDGAKANNWWERASKDGSGASAPKTLKDYYDAFERQLERYKKEADDAEKVNPDDRERVLAFRAHMRTSFLAFKEEATLENWAGGEQTAMGDDAAAAMVKAAA
jgi:hypothetical protein